MVARRQLRHLGVSDAVVDVWVAAGELQRIHRGVYAVAHTALAIEGWLTAAVLYAGPGAMLSHDTAAWWMGLTARRAQAIHVSTPRQVGCPSGLVVHGRRALERGWHRELPVAPLSDVLLGYAASSRPDDLRYVLAQAEYHGWLDIEDLETVLGRGRPGSAALRDALAAHQPQLAHTRSELERRLLALCERHRLPIPEFNASVAGWLVDAVWREQRVVVEVDGRAGHADWARIQSDHERDLALRAAGWVVLRYTWRQLERTPTEVARDLAAALGLTPRP